MALELELIPRGNSPSSALIVLLHGLNSSGHTWKREGQNWVGLLRADPKLEGVDVAVATYRSFLWNSELTRIASKGIKKTVGALLLSEPSPPCLNEGNPTPIKDLASELKQELDYSDYDQYEKIVLVGHSMGGLVGIYYLLELLERKMPSRVVGYISLATPFNGAELANFKKLGPLYTHEQIEALMTNNHFLDTLDRKWIELDRTGALNGIHFKSFYAEDDEYVSPNSAVPKVVNDKWADAISLPGGHSDILLVQERSSKSYRMVSDQIVKALKASSPPTPPEGGGGSERDSTVAVAVPANPSRLSPFQRRMEGFVEMFPTQLQAYVRTAAQEVAAQLNQYEEEQLRRFMASYCFPFEANDAFEKGLGALWENLTLLHLLDPSWKFHEGNEVANFQMKNIRAWKRMIHSVDQETMPEILLALARLRMEGPDASEIEDSSRELFPHRVILDNARRIPKYSRCKHCKPHQPFPFRNLLRDYTGGEDTEIFLDVIPGSNTYRKLENSEVCCTACLQTKVLDPDNLEDLRRTIKDVI